MPAIDDQLGPLREVLRQPDRRTWRRFLPPAPGAHRATAPPPGSPPDPWLVESADQDGTDRGPRMWQVVAGVLILAAGIVLGTGLLPASARRAPELTGLPPAPPASVDPAAPRPTTDLPAARVWPVERVEVVGRVVSTDAGQWEVGADGDIVTVGDWDCDRSPTPAVLRPSDGRVAVFDRWASEVGPVSARPVGAVRGATALIAGRTCGELVVRTTSGTEKVLDTRTAPDVVSP